MPGVRFNIAPVTRPIFASVGRLQIFTWPNKLEKNIRLDAPFGCPITEACKSRDVVNVRRVAGPITFPAGETGSSQGFVVSPCMAENRIRFWPGTRPIGVIRSCSNGGFRFSDRLGAWPEPYPVLGH